jgi:hypothetical protein
MKTKNKCKWFLKCTNEATTTQSHPILGEVPICQKCKDWYDKMNKKG